ncbi:MAG: phage tail tape measure protein, partial [Deltaproteobacteria bacterium]|nr:phage tail tape measure protein [Deltaproteobacteria bacterium]
MEIFRLFGTISINKAKAIADIKAVNAAGASFGTKIGNVFRKIGRVAKIAFTVVAVAAAAMFVSAIKKAADFELAMAKVNAISGATAEEFELLTEKAKELGLETAQTMTDIAGGMEAFARAGFNATEIILAMDGAVALAESQVMDLGKAVQITGAVLRGMQLPASEAERVANALAATASSAAVTVEELGESMKYLAPVAAALGMPLEEALTAVAKLGDAGLRGGRATRALATALEGLADPTDEAADALEQLGIDTFDAEGNFIGIIELVGQLEESFNELGYTSEQRMAAMGAIFAGAAGEMNILIGVSRAELDLYQESITDTTVAFDQQAAMLDTLKGQWQILKGSIELLLVTIGTDMMPILQRLVQDRIIPLVNSITKWIEESGGLSGVIDGMKTKIREWANEHPLLNSAIQSMWNILKGVGSFIKNVYQKDWAEAWENIKGVVTSAGKFIVDAVTSLWNALPMSDETKRKIIDGTKAVFDFVADKSKEAWEGIKASTEENAPGIILAWESLKEAGNRLWTAIVDLFGGAGESTITFRDVVKTSFDIILTVITTSINGIADLFNILSALLRGEWSQAWVYFKDFIGGIWEGIKNILDVTGLWNIGVDMAH